MPTTYLHLGSNLGDPRRQLDAARVLLEQRVGRVIAASGYYRTAAWGVTDQPDFINQVLVHDTPLAPHVVLRHALAIEQELGRVRLRRWGERTIDIDVLYYDDLVLDTPDLQIPHPRLHLRNFVLVPLREIASAVVHPILQLDTEQLLTRCPDDLPATRLPDGDPGD